MPNCKNCGRPLWDPASVVRGRGPVCMANHAAAEKDSQADLFAPSFSWRIRHHVLGNILVIIDNDAGGLSVTNSVGAVLDKIEAEDPRALSGPVIYRDSMDRYDEILLGPDKAFQGFRSIGVKNQDTAVRIAMQRAGMEVAP